MQALVYHGPGQKEWESKPDPSIAEPEAVLALLQPYPAELMEAYSVSPLVNSWENETPDVLTPAPELNPTLL